MNSRHTAARALRLGLALASVALLAGCGNITRLHVKDDSSTNLSARVLHRLGSGPGGSGLQFDYSNTRARSEQQIGAFETATLGSQSINGPALLRHSVRVESVQLLYNHLLFPGRAVEMEWFAGAAWVKTSWQSVSANPTDPRLSNLARWYGPAGGVLGRVRLASALALELRYGGAVDLSGHGDDGWRSSTELALAFKPVPVLALRAGVVETRTEQRPGFLSTELSVRARGPFLSLGLEF